MATAASQGKPKPDEKAEMDMTPMIDCVFLLMIFFVLVIDLSQKDLEDLILPKAIHVEEDDSPPEVRPIINIMQDGTVMHKGNEHYVPDRDGENYKPMLQILTHWKNDPNMKLKGETLKLGPRTIWLCDDPVLIRADKWTEWHYVGKFMMACSQSKDCAFWKLELAMSEEDKELKNLAKVKRGR
ncbi:MAG: biopolymer transporter ExbD [Planctomycetota bacterium]|jgi:biopolymer transport protein ExbD